MRLGLKLGVRIALGLMVRATVGQRGMDETYRAKARRKGPVRTLLLPYLPCVQYDSGLVLEEVQH